MEFLMKKPTLAIGNSNLSYSNVLYARVLKEYHTQISPILALIFNESLAQCNLPDECLQANVSLVSDL